MFTKVSVLVPTRGRVQRLRTLMESYDATTADDGYSELVFRVDDDDVETQRFLLDQEGSHVVRIGPRYDGYRSMPTFFNEMAACANGDVLMCGNDDMVFRTMDWDERILHAANQYPDGLFDLGVVTLNETHYPFSIVSRRVIERLGFLWDPRIFWGDIFLRDVMARFGRTKMLPDVIVDHDWAGYRPDRVFAETRGSKSVIEGSATYWSHVHAPAVAEAVEKLQGLLVVGSLP